MSYNCKILSHCCMKWIWIWTTNLLCDNNLAVHIFMIIELTWYQVLSHKVKDSEWTVVY